MAETLSQKFLESVRGSRDVLYAAAAAGRGGTAREAEDTLIAVARQVVVASQEKPTDIPAAIEKELRRDTVVPVVVPPAGSAEAEPVVMPADVWARFAAAVQMEAAASANAQALHAESELLKPDPMLAPKKRKVRDQEEAFDVASPRRLAIMIGAVVLAGLVITIYIVTRGSR
jgi:hypothetical protein